MSPIILALMMASASPSVPDEIVFDVCRAGWPDAQFVGGRIVDRNRGGFDRQADQWALTPSERAEVSFQCGRIADKLLKRYEQVRFDARGRVIR